VFILQGINDVWEVVLLYISFLEELDLLHVRNDLVQVIFRSLVGLLFEDVNDLHGLLILVQLTLRQALFEPHTACP